jgi:hypothetical protein
MKPELLWIQGGFILLTLVYFALLLRELKKGLHQSELTIELKKRWQRRTIFFLVVWAAFVTVWSASGTMADFSIFPLNFAPVIAVPLIATIALLFSPTLNEILRHVPAANLIWLQSFRIFVEVLLWALYVRNLLPEQMSFEGRNFDILSGLTAPVVAWLVTRNRISKTMLIVWNLACLALLINIVGIAILSTPSPWRIFMNDPSNTIVTYFPVSLLPGFLVPLAYILHLFCLKQLVLSEKPVPVVGRKV